MSSVFLVGFAADSSTVLIPAWVQGLSLCTIIFLASFTMTILYRGFHGYLITDWWLPQTFLWLQPLSELSLALAGYIIDCSAIIYVPHLESNLWLHDKLLLLFTLSCALLLFIVVLRVRIPCSLFHCHYFLQTQSKVSPSQDLSLDSFFFVLEIILLILRLISWWYSQF